MAGKETSQDTKNIVIIPGYGDRADYLKHITKRWPERLGLQPIIHPFGTLDSADTYDRHWQRLEALLEEVGECALIGVSFDGGVALRVLQEHPEIVRRAITVSAPLKLTELDTAITTNKYPMLERSLAHLTLN